MRYKSKYEMETLHYSPLRSLVSENWGSREHPEWMGQGDESIHFMQILFIWGKKKKASLTSSENICPPTSLSFKGPIDLTYTLVFNSFDLLGSPPVHPVFSTQTEAEFKSRQAGKAGGWGNDPSNMPALFVRRNDEAWDPSLERWMWSERFALQTSSVT